MCGIAGMVDMKGQRPPPEHAVRAMARALIHRGPDEEGFLFRPGLALASRRLSIVGLADGQQPVANEDRSIFAVFNGEFFDFVEKRALLEKQGHRFSTHCDTELLPHMWEDSHLAMLAQLRGQFAFALWDENLQELVLARDRFGICPLYWTVQDSWLLFASEIKGLLASGLVAAKPDLRGIDHIFTFSALPGPITCFEGVQLLPPAGYLRITPGSPNPLSEGAFWKMDFPNLGEEDPGGDAERLVDRFEDLLLNAVERRLRADVPVGSYLSGGVDSSMIAAMACRLKGSAINTYTVRVNSPELDELSAAEIVARHIGTAPPTVQEFGTLDAIYSYPHLIQAAESPVIDTSCAALLQLAACVHTCGQKVVLTGEGADEWLIGYPWYKAARLLGALDIVPSLRLGERARRLYLAANRVPQFPPESRQRTEEAVGGPNAWIDAFGMITLSKLRFYGAPMREVMAQRNPWQDLGIDLERARRWHPLNRGIWIAARVTLAGHLLQAKGDRVAMNSSVEVRYPFLDESVFDFLAPLHPRWKLRGLRDKHLLRLVGQRWLPPSVYKRHKVIFRAPLDSFHLAPEPDYVRQLLSEESLRRTGYFDVAEVQRWRSAYQKMPAGSLPRLSVELGLVAVVATQLWHHTFIDPSLSELPPWRPHAAAANNGISARSQASRARVA
jgi:asparagine synthase (glutamine-hydrolysing)